MEEKKKISVAISPETLKKLEDGKYNKSKLIDSLLTEHFKKEKQNETHSKWDSLGFLDGLKGHVKPEIAALYECCKSTLLVDDKVNEKKSK